MKVVLLLALVASLVAISLTDQVTPTVKPDIETTKSTEIKSSLVPTQPTGSAHDPTKPISGNGKILKISKIKMISHKLIFSNFFKYKMINQLIIIRKRVTEENQNSQIQVQD